MTKNNSYDSFKIEPGLKKENFRNDDEYKLIIAKINFKENIKKEEIVEDVDEKDSV